MPLAPLAALLANAVKFTRPAAEPCIQVDGMALPDGGVQLCVRDNGAVSSRSCVNGVGAGAAAATGSGSCLGSPLAGFLIPTRFKMACTFSLGCAPTESQYWLV